jgi:hypothetical protein
MRTDTPSQKLTMKDVLKAREKALKRENLYENIQAVDFDFETPIIIKSDISLQNVLDFTKKHDEKLSFRVCFHPNRCNDPEEEKDPRKILGKYIAYDLPTSVHEVTASTIVFQILKGVQKASNDIDMLDHIESSGSSKARYGATVKEPDAGLRPKRLNISPPNVLDQGDGFPFPNIVIEIAYQNESFQLLLDELASWISEFTSVQIALGVKIFGRRVDGSRRLVAILLRRNAPMQMVEFGTNIHALVDQQLFFPLAELFANVNPADIPDKIQDLIDDNTNLGIDLQDLRTAILGKCQLHRLCSTTYLEDPSIKD